MPVMDFFDDDVPSAPPGRPVGKFQPKFKGKARAPPPKKEPSAANASVPRLTEEIRVIASHPKIPNNDTMDVRTQSNAGLPIPSMGNPRTTDSANVDKDASLKQGDGQCFNDGEPVIENTEVFIGLDTVDEVVPQSTAMEGATIDALSSHYGEDTSGFSMNQDSDNVEGVHLDKAPLETEGGQLFTSMDSSDFMYEGNTSTGKNGKFRPKLRPLSRKNAAVGESVSHPRDDSVVRSESQYGFVDGLVDGGSPNVSHPTPGVALDPCIDPLNQEGELHETPHPSLSEYMNSETVPVVSAVVDVNERGETAGISEISEEAAIKKGKGSKMKKSSSSSKKAANGSDKSVQKRKKTTEASEKSNEGPPKKFSRSTRRRNRSVSKALLETPEDEIDYQRLPIKDLIMFAEHKERHNKEVGTAKTANPTEDRTADGIAATAPSERASDNLWDDPPYDDYDDMYTSGQAEGSFDDPSASTTPRDTTYFNYGSHMEKTSRVKWTKQDTELFYEGVRQFGSDLSMIQHLFPGLTRHQIKLKYKKEERQQPMRLSDALTNRATDLSHYKRVIVKLQEQIREEERQMDGDETPLGANEEEGATDTAQPEGEAEAGKSGQKDVSGSAEDFDEAKTGSPTASHDSEVDTFDWSQYKSEL